MEKEVLDVTGANPCNDVNGMRGDHPPFIWVPAVEAMPGYCLQSTLALLWRKLQVKPGQAKPRQAEPSQAKRWQAKELGSPFCALVE